MWNHRGHGLAVGALYFGGEPHSRLNLQAAYDLRVVEIHNAERIEREVIPRAT